MNKTILKRTIVKKQNGVCQLSGELLGIKNELVDTHRKNPKRNGGKYTVENTIVITPVQHMIEHGNLRIRTGELLELKKLVDAREQAMKFKNKASNQLLAIKRRIDELHPHIVNWLELQVKEGEKEVNLITNQITKVIKVIAKNDPLVRSALGVRAVGIITIAYCLTYIDFEKADHASSLWKYAGLDKPSHERYEKTVAGGGNKRLRCVLYTMAESQMKLKGAYRDVYDRTKTRLENSDKITKSRNTQGKLIECAWKDTKPCHRHGAALRNVMKHFLADYWMVGRKLSGLPVSPLYPEAILGGVHKTIQPEERGWKY
jgi:hypothetical protein